MKITIYSPVHNNVVLAVAFVLCNAMVAYGEDRGEDAFMKVDSDRVAFSDVEVQPRSSPPLSSRTGDWLFSVSHEADRQVLSAKSSDKLVTQSITPDAVHKRFVFDMKRQRFEPMRQEIRIEQTDERKLRQIEELTGVTALKRYDNLGFSIVKIAVDVNPVEVLRTLREEFESDDARILTGLFEYEPM